MRRHTLLVSRGRTVSIAVCLINSSSSCTSTARPLCIGLSSVYMFAKSIHTGQLSLDTPQIQTLTNRCTLYNRVYMFARYDTRCCSNVRSKADISQLNLPHRTKLKSGKEKKRHLFKLNQRIEFYLNNTINPRP